MADDSETARLERKLQEKLERKAAKKEVWRSQASRCTNVPVPSSPRRT